MLLCLALLAFPRRGPKPSSSSSRAAASSAPRVWEDTTWDFREEQSKSKRTSGGRSRAAKREKVYADLRSYADFFSPLLAAEWRAEQDALAAQIEQWPAERLQSEGWLLRKLQAQRLVRDFFGEPIVQLGLAPSGGDTERPPLPFHRFTVGDVVALNAGDEPSLPSSLQGGTPSAGDDADERVPIDGVVLQRTSTALQIVTRMLPPALTRAASSSRGPKTVGPFCLTRGASAVPYERCVAAVSALSDPDSVESSVCPQLRTLIVASHRGGADASGGGGGGSGGAEDALAIELAADPPAFLSGSGRAAAASIAKAAMKAAVASGTMPPPPPSATSAAMAVEAGELRALNPSQVSVIRKALARRLTLIQGPPGTGKTRTACALLAACVALHANPATRPPAGTESKHRRGGSKQADGSSSSSKSLGGGSPCLAVASSNVAADELLAGLTASGVRTLRVGQPASVRESLRGYTLDAALEKSEQVLSARASLKAAQDRGNAAGVGVAFEELRRAEVAESRRLLAKADVVVASCVGAGRLAEIVAEPKTRGGSGGGGGGRGRGGRGGGDRDGSFPRGGGRGGRERGSRGRGGGRGGDGNAPFFDGRGDATASAPPPISPFRTVLIDEATQSTEPASLVALLHGASQLILVGDSKQLPPTVTDRRAKDGGLGLSLFERLQTIGIEPLLLDTQYRMHPAIAQHPSKAFYMGRIKSGVCAAERPLLEGVRWPNPDVPVVFVNVRGAEQNRRISGPAIGAKTEADQEVRTEEEEVMAADDNQVASNSDTRLAAASLPSPASTSYANPGEAKAVAAVVDALLQSGALPASSVGVITPYAAQATLLQQRSLGRGGVEVSSVDGFQGREKEAIVFSAVRCNDARKVGFLSDERRLNVAITRAKRGLVLVGDEQTLSSSPVWRDYLRFLRKNGCVLDGVEDLLP